VERATLPRRLNWQSGIIVQLVDENARTRSLVLEVPGWARHRAGQHVDVRLTAEDGYQTERSYSIASAPEDNYVVITVERIEDGEVSPYLTQELQIGDTLELRGPIGGYFVWEESSSGPLLLIAGGSGVVPLRAMLRHHQATGSEVPVRILYSVRNLADVIYQEELAEASKRAGVDICFTLTDQQPAGWTGYMRRIDAAMLAEVGFPIDDHPLTYICGPTGLVEAAATELVELGHDPATIKTERFGPTGSRPIGG
jgi:ferredoxin-NADP reductase